MISMNTNKNISARPGIALLAVLMIVMVITVMALGFLSRSDAELACGENMMMRTQMDYLAESGLEHARGLILNPQDIGSEDWTATAQQLVAGSDDYYDLVVVRDDVDRCNYTIDCNSYRERLDGSGEIERIGRSNLRATLRLDPCIAYWAGTNAAISQLITVDGDVYCNGDLSGNGYIEGDVFASGSITASNLTGRKNETVGQAPVDWPGLNANDFSSSYCIDSASHSVKVIDPNISDPIVDPGGNNPARVYYSNSGDPNNPVSLNGDVVINGTLVVGGDLTVRGTNNVITAVRDFPALLVSGELTIEDGATLQIEGLAQIEEQITVDPNTTITVTGGLFIENGGIVGSASSSIDISAARSMAAIRTWPTEGAARNWSQAAGAFFRSIERK